MIHPIIKEDVVKVADGSSELLRKLNGKTVLITGANGMIARYFTYLLGEWNRQRSGTIHVCALARNGDKAKALFSDYLDEQWFRLMVQDIRDALPDSLSTDYILHAASSASPRFIREDPVGIIQANVQGTQNVLELQRSCPDSRMVFTSTREVYGEVTGQNWLTESTFGALDPMDSRSCYPESKRMAEQLCLAYRNQYGVNSVIARIAHTYGPGMEIDHDGRVMSDFIGDAVHSRDIVLNSDGSAIRAFCYVTDALAALLKLLIDGEPGTAYNISNESEPISIRELAGLICEISGKSIVASFQPISDRSGYVSYARVGLSGARLSEIGWKPVVDLRRGIDRTLKSFA